MKKNCERLARASRNQDELDFLLSQAFPAEVLNAHTDHIVVLNDQGEIIFLNSAWLEFSRTNSGDPGTANVGCNYLKVCKESYSRDGSEKAQRAFEGIKSVIDNKRSSFELEYPCHSPTQKRWFSMHCTQMHNRERYIVIAHSDITRTKLYEEQLIAQSRELEVLHTIHSKVNSKLSVDTIIQSILMEINTLLSPDFSLLFLKEGDQLVIQEILSPENLAIPYFSAPHQVGSCLCGLAVSTKTPIYSYDINQDQRCSWEACKTHKVKSFAAIPLIHEDEAIGCLGIASKSPVDFETRKRFLEAAAEDVTIILRKALLYEKVELSAKELETQLQERKRLEDMIVHQQKLEAVGTLAGGIAHDFNNILSAILGYASLAKSQISHNLQVAADIKQITTSANRGKELIRQILSFSRKDQQNQSVIELYPVIAESIKLATATLPSTVSIGHSLEKKCGNIQGNSTQIHQIIINLCTNAAHAMEESGGSLFIELTKTALNKSLNLGHMALSPGSYARILLKDTGTGIPNEIIDRIFDPYFSTKSLDKGSGLGLSIVRNIVNSHKGGITIETAEDVGTTFTVYLPLTDREVETIPIAEVTIVKGNQRILVIDDEPALASLNRRILESLGYSVTEMHDSRDALEHFRDQPDKFDLVLTDQTMPGLTGDQLTAELTAIRPDIPVIICSGYHSDLDREKALQTKALAYLKKPFSIAQLSSTLQKIFSDT